MAARPGGYADKDAQARRLETVRELWQEDRSLQCIAERLGLHPTAISKIAKGAGLPPRKRNVG